MLRIWPLYGVKERKGVYLRRFFLWPFVHQRAERLDSERPAHTFYVLPFYGRRDQGGQASRFYLFPLWLQQWNRQDERSRRLDLLWPLFSAARGPDGSSLLAFRPLYSRVRRPGEEITSCLLGLVTRGRIAGPDSQETLWRLLWAGRIGLRRDPERETRRIDLWPVYRSLRVREFHGGGHGFVRVPYLLPMRGLEPDGWNRHYNQLFELYGARWRGDEQRSSLLFGLRETRSSPDSRWESWGGPSRPLSPSKSNATGSFRTFDW